MIGIYKITSPSGKVYIGQSWNIIHRWADYGRLTAKYQRLLCFSFNKYGKKAHTFEVIHQLPVDVDQSVMNDYEQLYIDLYVSAGAVMLNLAKAGGNGKPSEETRLKLSRARLGKKPWNTGLRNHLSPEVVEIIRAKSTGVKQSPETIEKRMKHIRGRVNSNEHKFKVGAKKAKLTKAQAQELRTKYQTQRITMKQLSVEYNIAEMTVFRILHNKIEFYKP